MNNCGTDADSTFQKQTQCMCVRASVCVTVSACHTGTQDLSLQFAVVFVSAVQNSRL